VKKLYFLILFIYISLHIQSQNVVNDNIKAQYILSFVRYLDWKNESNITKYKIGVYASNKVMFNVLRNQTKNLKIKDKPIDVVFYNNISEFNNLQIVYIDSVKSKEAKGIYNKIVDKNILMVTDGLSGVNETMMNFMPLFYVRVELHEENLEKEGFFLPSVFKTLAKKYKKNYKELFSIVSDSLEIERKVITEQKETLNKQLTEIKNKEKRIKTLNDTLTKQLNLVEKKEKELNLFSLLIKKKDSTLLSKTKILTLQKQEIKLKITQIAQTEAKLQKQKNEIIAKQKILGNLSTEINKQKTQIQKQKGELKQSYQIIKLQKYINIFIIIVLFLILLLAVFIYRNYRNKKKANKILELQNTEITKQKNLIQEQNEELNQLVEEVTSQKDEIEAQRDLVQNQKNKIEEIYDELTQSIDYAMRIQHSVLPDEETLKIVTTDYFVLFLPKDKVSGDFYWWKTIGDKTYLAVADCTGHGVPGAFMSMLGSTFLNFIINEHSNLKSGEILNILRQKTIETLKQTGKLGEQKDGMDISFIIINHKSNKIQFSGAYNPLYIIANKEITDIENAEPIIQNSKFFYEIKPDKMPIAIYDKMQEFSTHKIKLNKGDQLYLFSDGYADQFGGEYRKKFKYKPFKELLLNNSNNTFEEQKINLANNFNIWRNNGEQIDDITVVGIKI